MYLISNSSRQILSIKLVPLSEFGMFLQQNQNFVVISTSQDYNLGRTLTYNVVYEVD